MADSGVNQLPISSTFPTKLVKWRVCEGQIVREGNVLAFYEKIGQSDDAKSFITQPKLKSTVNGRVKKLLVSEGDLVPISMPVVLIEETGICEHKTIMKELCCDCGADLRKLQGEQDEPSSPTSATVSMIHNIPELKVTQDEAEAVGKKDEERLLGTRKLALVVDLDQTLIHTTVDLVPADMKGVQHFCLPGHPMWYHTKFRPWAHKFLQNISRLYELHIFTMGSRMYAHTIARMLDPEEKLFGYRIRSRDDCFNAFSKSNDLRSLFPCGDSMVCIIDDRVDVWNHAANLIKVKPYQFFKGVGDINAPPEKQEVTPPENSDDPENTSGDVAAQEVANSGEESSTREGSGDGSESRIPEDILEEVNNCEYDSTMEGSGNGPANRKAKDIQEEANNGEENSTREGSGDGSESRIPEDILEGVNNCEDDSTMEGSGNGPANRKAKDIQEGVNNGEENSPREGSGDGSESKKHEDEKVVNNVINKADFVENGLKDSKNENETMEIEEGCGDHSEDKETSKVPEENSEEGDSGTRLINGSNNNDHSQELPLLEENNIDKKHEEMVDQQNEIKVESENLGKENSSAGEYPKEVKNENKENTEENTEENKVNENIVAKEQEVLMEDEKDHQFTPVIEKYAYEDEDDYLVHLEEILEKIHQKFYSVLDEIKAKGIQEAQNDPIIMKYCTPNGNAPCTKQIIKRLRVGVLQGANVVFTGVIPTNVQPEESEIWQRAQALGARIAKHVICPKDASRPDDVTTHVIAARLGTEKAYRAIKTPGIKLVSPEWLWCCAHRWEWVDERLFPVEGVEKYKKQIRTQGTPRGTPQDWSNSNEADAKTKGLITVNDGANDPDVFIRSRSCSSSSADVLMASLHPLLSFSSMEMAAIDKEVEELMNSSTDGSDVIGSISGSSSSSSSGSSSSSSGTLSGKRKKSGKKSGGSDSANVLPKKRKKGKQNDSEESDDYAHRSTPSDDDNGDDDEDDDMAALLEAELSHY